MFRIPPSTGTHPDAADLRAGRDALQQRQEVLQLAASRRVGPAWGAGWWCRWWGCGWVEGGASHGWLEGGGSAWRGRAPRGAVLLQHGLLDCSASWVNNDADKSLAFVLADAGYDVWMGNVRGSTYSREHVWHDVSSKAFWEFSFDAMALADLPAMVAYALEASGEASLAYVGHSQGTTILLAALAQLPPLAPLISSAALLAPVAFATHIESRAMRLLAQHDVSQLFTLLGVKEFLPGTENEMFGAVCQRTPALCGNLIDLICGYNATNMDAAKLAANLRYVPAGTSTRNMAHWSQRVMDPDPSALRMYDYGARCWWGLLPQDCNRYHYGSDAPPTYDLASISTPLALFAGGADVLADTRDVLGLAAVLPPHVLSSLHSVDDYGHLDFVWAEDANARVYQHVLAELEAHRGGRGEA